MAVFFLLAAAASAPVASAGSGVGMPSGVVVAGAPSPQNSGQRDEAQTDGENCDANSPVCPCPHDLSELDITPPEGM